MKTTYHYGVGAFKKVEEIIYWVLVNKKGQFYEQFELVNGHWTVSFTDKILSAATWDTRKKAREWILKNNSNNVARKSLKPKKVMYRKIISYDVM